MAKVDWITWKTEPNEIINSDLVEEKIQQYFDDYYTCMKPTIYEEIKNEILKGGLSKDAFNVSGKSPSNEIALEILQKIDEICEIFNGLKGKVKTAAEEQKHIEKEQLIEVIQQKIAADEEVIEDITSQVSFSDNSIANNTREDILYISANRIEKLNDKLNAISML